MNSVSKLKIILGYALLLVVLLSALFFVHREVEKLTQSEGKDMQWADSLLVLLKEKDENTIRMLRTLSEMNEKMLSTSDIEHIIAERIDSVVVQQRVQRRVITHRDTMVTRPKKKGFFKRLGEVFSPPKKDTAIQVKTSLEFAVDTVIDVYNPTDSLQAKLREITEKKRADSVIVRRRNYNLKRMDHMLSARIDSLLKNYEEETLQRARTEAEYQQEVRQRSARTIAGVAVGAVLLAAFFLKEPITGKKVLGIALGAGGALLLIMGSQSGSAPASGGSNPIWGDILVLGAQLSYALYIVLFKNFVQRYSLVTIMKWMFTYAFIFALPFSYNSLIATDWSALELPAIGSIAFIVVCATFLSYMLILVGQKNLRPTVAGMYNYVQPVVACIVSICLGLDSFNLMKGVAVVFIFGGVYLVTISKSRQEMEAHEHGA